MMPRSNWKTKQLVLALVTSTSVLTAQQSHGAPLLTWGRKRSGKGREAHELILLPLSFGERLGLLTAANLRATLAILLVMVVGYRVVPNPLLSIAVVALLFWPAGVGYVYSGVEPDDELLALRSGRVFRKKDRGITWRVTRGRKTSPGSETSASMRCSALVSLSDHTRVDMQISQSALVETTPWRDRGRRVRPWRVRDAHRGERSDAR
jgi:hypothetical protein